MKLEIESVEFKNFLSFGSSKQIVDLGKGVNVVLGRDVEKAKSNGAGKSSFLETVPFALFGQVQRNIRKEQIINWKNKKKCEVVCHFKINEDRYAVLRSIKPDNFEIYRNDFLLDKAPHVREYQRQLDDILGINFQTFMSLIHSNINSSQKILAMSKPDKRKFLERVFNLGIYSQIHEKANERMRTMEERAKLLNSEIEQKRWVIRESEERIEKLSREIDKVSEIKKELREAENKYNEIYTTAAYSEFERAKETKSGCEKKVEEYEKSINAITSKIDKIRFEKMTPVLKELEFIEREKQANKEAEKYGKRFEEFIEEWGELEDINASEEEMKGRLTILKTSERSLNEQLGKLAIQIANNKGRIKQYKEIVLKFRDGTCPTCGQSVKDEEKLVEAKTIYRASVIESEKLQEKHDAVNSEIWEMEESIRLKEREISRMSEVKEKYHRLKGLAGKIVQVTGGEKEKKKLLSQKKKYSDMMDELEQEGIKLGEKYEEWSEKLVEADKEVEELGNTVEEIEDAKRFIENLKERIKSEEESKKGIKKLIKSEKDSVMVKSGEVRHGELERDRLSSVIDYLEYVKEICKDENIKQYAISSLMPYLNQQTNHYLSEVGYGFFAVVDKWLEAEIKGPSISNGSYGSLSGGESRGIDLALQFALLDIARIQANRWPDILIMDEILDSSVDTAGIEKLMDIIRVKQDDDDSRVFIISHRDEIGEDFVADNVYTVVKEGGYSRVVT